MINPDESRRRIEAAVSFVMTGPPRSFFEWPICADDKEGVLHCDYRGFGLIGDTPEVLGQFTRDVVKAISCLDRRTLLVWRRYPQVHTQDDGKYIASLRFEILDESLEPVPLDLYRPPELNRGFEFP